MTNEEIIRQFPYVLLRKDIPGLLDLARQDEREKMQGVECWISWDKHIEHDVELVNITSDKPRATQTGAYEVFYRSDNDTISALAGSNFAGYLGLKEGQCKKFRIVEELP